MSRGRFGRTRAVSAQIAVLIVTLGCESGPTTAPTAPGETSAERLRETYANAVPPTLGPVGVIGGTVTINGEARPVVWVEVQRGSWPWAYGPTIPNGSWEWEQVPAGDYRVVVKTPPGLTCDTMSKPATVTKGQRTVVNFACFGDVKGSIQGFASHEFGTYASARVTATGPVNRDTISNGDGFFAFENLPPGEYVVGSCNPVKVSVRVGATAFAMVDCS